MGSPCMQSQWISRLEGSCAPHLLHLAEGVVVEHLLGAGRHGHVQAEEVGLGGGRGWVSYDRTRLH